MCLKCFLKRRLFSPNQHKWVTKMLGYNYEIMYKKGKENFVVDGLSREFEEDGSLFALSLPSLGWLKESCMEWLVNSTLRELIQPLQEDPNSHKGYTWKQDTLRYKGCIVLEKDSL